MQVEGNNNAMKFKTPEKRKALCKKWCEHLAAGLTRDSFPDCDPQTFRKYCRLFPEDFNADGALDLAVNRAGGVDILLGGGDGSFTPLPVASIAQPSRASDSGIGRPDSPPPQMYS